MYQNNKVVKGEIPLPIAACGGIAMPMELSFSPAAPVVMGVLNVTPDSFSDGGRFFDSAKAITRGLKLAADGAQILDIGGESTRPGANPVSQEEELRRVIPVIEGLKGAVTAAISIDTRNSAVAKAAMDAGASIWNDVSALTHSQDSLAIAAQRKRPVILMHAQGDPKTMQDRPYYDDVVEDVYAYLNTRMEAAIKAGVSERHIIVDPGIGFGKNLEHNLTLLRNLDRFQSLGVPVLLGASRKRFIEAIENRAGVKNSAVNERLGGSVAAVLAGLNRGVSIFRVHDVKETRQAIMTARAIDSA